MSISKMSALEHLGRSLLGRRYSPETVFAMFAAYFDESGGDDFRYTFVCGYGATVRQWEAFEVDWKLYLASFKVPYLHMKEFSQSKQCYKSWYGNDGLRANFLGMAAEIINSHLKRSFIALVSHEVFDEVDKIYALRKHFQSPYALAGRSCIGMGNAWSRNTKTGALDIEYIFEDGGPDKAGLISACEALPPFLPAPSFKPGRDQKPTNKWPDGKRGIVQLQAADYLAYESRRIIFDLEKFKSGERQLRKSLKALTKVPLSKAMWTKMRLVRLCSGANFEKRIP